MSNKIHLTESQFRDYMRYKLHEGEKSNKKIRLSESQFKEYLNFLNEKRSKYNLPKSRRQKIYNAGQDLARSEYGNMYGKRDVAKTKRYFPKGDASVNFDADIASGLFSVGNEKLSDDTLIINFTSALNCPTLNDCPITQKACYAVAGEVRLKDVRRKNLIVQNLVNQLRSHNNIGALFDIALLYVEQYKEVDDANKKKGNNVSRAIKFIRYNEAGDFPNDKTLIAAAKFSKFVRDKYGIMSMAYTANPRIHPDMLCDGEPIDKIIKINRSREDIAHSEGTVNQKFFGIPMDASLFTSNPDINLEKAYCDVDYVSDNVANSLKVEAPVESERHPGIKSVPVLNYGKWNGGEGYYYVCPCSFWKYNKDKATEKYLQSIGLLGQSETLSTDEKELQKQIKFFKSKMSDSQKKTLNSLLNKIVSPCGIKCAVCHDMEGGITRDGKKNILDYTVVTATHGATKGNFNADYAEQVRQGGKTAKNAVYNADNARGKWDGYDSEEEKEALKKASNERVKRLMSVAPIHSELLQNNRLNESLNDDASKQLIQDIQTSNGEIRDYFNCEEYPCCATVDVEFDNGNSYHLDFYYGNDGINEVGGFYYGENYPNEDGIDIRPINDLQTCQMFDNQFGNEIYEYLSNSLGWDEGDDEDIF